MFSQWLWILIGIIWFWSANPSPEGKAQIFPPISWVKGYFGYCVCSANRVLLLPLWYLNINRVKLLICFRLLDLLDLSWLVQSVEDELLMICTLWTFFSFLDFRNKKIWVWGRWPWESKYAPSLRFHVCGLMEWNGSRKGRFCGLKFLCPVLRLKSSASMVLLRTITLNSLIPLSGPKLVLVNWVLYSRLSKSWNLMGILSSEILVVGFWKWIKSGFFGFWSCREGSVYIIYI